MKKYSKYLLSGLVFFALLSLANYILKLNWNLRILAIATVIYVLFSLFSDIFINKKFSKDLAADVEKLSEEETKKFQNLIDRGVLFLHIPKKLLVDSWDKQFDSLVSSEEKENKENYSDQFRWHLFSFDLLPSLKGDEAKAAFDKEEKHELYLFFEYAEETYIIGNANLLTAKDVDELFKKSSIDSSDFYFFDPLHQWTYVVPHEEELGPYFYKAK